ncbi:MAG: GNAT family N-acetyltransferase [Rickettsiales bacterium]|jgi:RimJ/RimL family protein N-acetyltransferase|nr:GNAT family N-acetyltransferase [Rickettsiales bacterium]
MLKKIALENGREIIFRKPVESDFPAFLKFIEKIGAETAFTNQYPEQQPKDREKTLARWSNPASFLLCAFDGGAMIAQTCFNVSKPDHPWLKYTAGFGISIVKKYWNRGIGTILLKEIDREAARRGLHRIEGHVRSTNIRGISLYLKCGYAIEGHSREVAFIDGRWVDEYIIAKILAAKAQ